MKKNDLVDRFIEKNFVKIVFIAVIILFSSYIAYSFYFPAPSQDCDYEQYGCQGDNRFGQ